MTGHCWGHHAHGDNSVLHGKILVFNCSVTRTRVALHLHLAFQGPIGCQQNCIPPHMWLAMILETWWWETNGELWHSWPWWCWSMNMICWSLHRTPRAIDWWHPIRIIVNYILRNAHSVIDNLTVWIQITPWRLPSIETVLRSSITPQLRAYSW